MALTTGSKVTEGDYTWHLPALGETVKTRYYIHHPTTSTYTAAPLVILHGGPGIPSIYMQTHARLADQFNIPVIFYDQIGCGQSTRLPNKMGDETFWSTELFLKELDGVIDHLELRSKHKWNKSGEFGVLGHSWGAMLGATYATAQPGPPGLSKLVLASGLARMQDWMDEGQRLRATLPPEVQEVLDRCEREDKTESQEYENAVDEFYARFLCRLNPMPQELMQAFVAMREDPTVYHTMFGKNEFSCTGPTKSFDIIKDLHKIAVPTLITNGRYDEATDRVVRPFFERIPRVKWVTFANSAHMAHMEEVDRYMEVLDAFLTL